MEGSAPTESFRSNINQRVAIMGVEIAEQFLDLLYGILSREARLLDLWLWQARANPRGVGGSAG